MGEKIETEIVLKLNTEDLKMADRIMQKVLRALDVIELDLISKAVVSKKFMEIQASNTLFDEDDMNE